MVNLLIWLAVGASLGGFISGVMGEPIFSPYWLMSVTTGTLGAVVGGILLYPSIQGPPTVHIGSITAAIIGAIIFLVAKAYLMRRVLR